MTTKATPETIEQAVDQLEAEGEVPTVRKVGAMLGGGSLATIHKYLPVILDRRKAEARKAAELPSDLSQLSADLATKMAAAIFSRVDKDAAARVERIEADARERISSAHADLNDAINEIDRLEVELQRATVNLSEQQSAATQATTRAATAEGRVTQLESELTRLSETVSNAHKAEREALAEAAELRGQVAALEKMFPKNSESKIQPEVHGAGRMGADPD